MSDLENMDIESRLIKLELALKCLTIYDDPMQQKVWKKNIIFRLEKLESSKITQHLDPQVWKFLTERIDGLENFINKNWNSKRHEPHKCPLCDGKGVEFDRLKRGEGFNSKCKTCEGKGIVWG